MTSGILTFHDGINHGAFLQAYALWRVLNSNSIDAKIINYKNFRHWSTEYRKFLLVKRPQLFINNLKKIRKFKQCHKKLPMTPFTTQANKIKNFGLRNVVIGSDEVWNFNNPLFGFDSIYFGNEKLSANTFSYAASFGACSDPATVPEPARLGLGKLDAIMVRDRNSQQMIQSLLGINPPIVLDPTFLYEFDSDIKECPSTNFILIYAPWIQPQFWDPIKLLAKKHKKTLIAVGYRLPWVDKNIVALDPFEWLGYFKNADAIITSTFHGSIFSIIHNKPFLSLPEKSKTNKISSLLEQLGLSERCIDTVENLDILFDHQIEFDNVNQQIAGKRKFSIDSLLQNIK